MKCNGTREDLDVGDAKNSCTSLSQEEHCVYVKECDCGYSMK